MIRYILFLLFLGITILAGGVDEKSPDLKRINKLAKLITHHKNLYWQGKSEISDREYDALIQKLRDLAPDHSLVGKVGGVQLDKNKKVKHLKPMLSLRKVYSDSELFKWIETISRSSEESFLIQPKYDGIAAELNGKTLSTRGNGEFGYNISHVLPFVEILKASNTGNSFRGELIITKSNFENLNLTREQNNLKAYKTARSAVVALVKSGKSNPSNVKLTLVDYKFHSLIITREEFNGKWTLIHDEIRQYPYPMDGLVVKLKDQVYAESLGATAHHPRSMVAFKFVSAAKPSVIRNIKWQFAEKGLVPVAEFDKVVINSREIRRATLHNAEYILKNDILVDDDIFVSLSGDTIPKIKTIPRETTRKINLPKKCFECGNKLVFESPHLKCTNKTCPGVCYAKLRKILRGKMTKGIGDKTLYKLVKSFSLRSEEDLMKLSLKQIMSLPGIGQKKGEKIRSALQTLSKQNIKADN